MARKRVSGKYGLSALEDEGKLRQGTTQYMGASSNPDLVYIEDVGDSKVTVRRYPFYPEDTQTLDKDIAKDLISQGNDTMVEEGRRIARDFDTTFAEYTEYVGSETPLREIQTRDITFEITGNMSPREVERKYRDKYGLETNMATRDGGFETRVTKENLSQIRDLPGIKVTDSQKPSSR
jgi:hypothetical protein